MRRMVDCEWANDLEELVAAFRELERRDVLLEVVETRDADERGRKRGIRQEECQREVRRTHAKLGSGGFEGRHVRPDSIAYAPCIPCDVALMRHLAVRIFGRLNPLALYVAAENAAFEREGRAELHVRFGERLGERRALDDSTARNVVLQLHDTRPRFAAPTKLPIDAQNVRSFPIRHAPTARQATLDERRDFFCHL